MQWKREMKVSSIRETELKLTLEMHFRIIPSIFTGFRAASHSILLFRCTLQKDT